MRCGDGAAWPPPGRQQPQPGPARRVPAPMLLACDIGPGTAHRPGCRLTTTSSPTPPLHLLPLPHHQLHWLPYFVAEDSKHKTYLPRGLCMCFFLGFNIPSQIYTFWPLYFIRVSAQCHILRQAFFDCFSEAAPTPLSLSISLSCFVFSF